MNGGGGDGGGDVINRGGVPNQFYTCVNVKC